MASYRFETYTKTYTLVFDQLDFDQATQAATQTGGTLAAVNSRSEQNLIYNHLSKQFANSPEKFSGGTASDGGGVHYVWLGGSDGDSEGDWSWDNGSRFSYDNWGFGTRGSEPDNFLNQDGLAIGLENWPSGSADGAGFGNAGQWNDIDLSNALAYLIETNKMPMIGTGGNNTLRGSAQGDILKGLGGKDKLFGLGGNDLLNGGTGNDTLSGAAGRDHLQGRGGRDMLKGGAGRDIVDGGKGNDILSGGSGADTFRFRGADGRDTIRDFAQGIDRVKIINGANDMNDLGFAQNNADVVVDFANTQITFADSTVADIQNADNFLF